MPAARSAAPAYRRKISSGSRSRVRAVRTPIQRIRWDRAGRTALLLVFGVVMALYVQHALSYISTRAQAEHDLAVVARLVRENRALRREEQALNDPATIRRDARVLGMVMPGERSWVLNGLPGH